jgi:hypothetical protein
MIFAGDASLDAEAASRWWVCAPCRIAMFGDDGGRKQAARWD